MQLLLNTPGLKLSVRAGSFLVTHAEERRSISPRKIDSIAVTTDCLLSSAAIELAVEHQIPIYLFDRIGDATGCLRSSYFESIATLRRRQVFFDHSPAAMQWILELFAQKTEAQIAHLRYLANRRPGSGAELSAAITDLVEAQPELDQFRDLPVNASSARLMGWEGARSRVYWRAVSSALNESWQFPARSRRPAQDPFNAVLNYLYGMLYTTVEQALFAAGLDPHLGVLHTDQYDAPTLAFDLIEPFRPFVDRLLTEQFLGERVLLGYFDRRKRGIYLNWAGKAFFIPRFNDWLTEPRRFRGRERSNRMHIHALAADLATRIRSFPLPDEVMPTRKPEP